MFYATVSAVLWCKHVASKCIEAQTQSSMSRCFFLLAQASYGDVVCQNQEGPASGAEEGVLQIKMIHAMAKLLPLLACVSSVRTAPEGRHVHPRPRDILSALQLAGMSNMTELTSSEFSRTFCTNKLPYFRNRLCMEVRSHTKAVENLAAALVGSKDVEEADAVLGMPIPDLTLDLAWMGCSTCVPEMRACSPSEANQLCREDPSTGLRFPWVRILPLSLQALLIGQCFSLGELLVTPGATAAFAPFLGALAPYLGGILGSVSALVMDKLLLGRYCLYLTTHLAGETAGMLNLTQDSSCITHLYEIHIPGIFGLVKPHQLEQEPNPLVCWPTAEARERVENTMMIVEKATETEETDPLTPPRLGDPETLKKDQICRSPTVGHCLACETLVQAASWRLWNLRQAAAEEGLQAAEEQLAAVESRMLIHANTAAQCVDDTSDCKEDYSLCILQPGKENATECTAADVYWPATKNKPCSLLCTSSCGALLSSEPYCRVAEENADANCTFRGDRVDELQSVQYSKLGSGHWVKCNPGPAAKFTTTWQHRLLNIIRTHMKVGNFSNTTDELFGAARQVMHTFGQPSPSFPEFKMLDVAMLRIAQLLLNQSFTDVRYTVCKDAACCNDEVTRVIRSGKD
ncbi:unnamed protein product [Effrenium voratum]|nr:unnamed protein product [Effrenium voratum]